MIKITSKLLSELPEGVFYVDKNLFIRTRNGKQAYLFIYRFNKKKHELRIGDASLITPAMAVAAALTFPVIRHFLSRKKKNDGKTTE